MLIGRKVTISRTPHHLTLRIHIQRHAARITVHCVQIGDHSVSPYRAMKRLIARDESESRDFSAVIDRALIPGVKNAATLASCGRFLLANSYRTSVEELVRFDVEGANLKVLATTQSYGPTCAPDGKSVFYVDLARPQTIRRIPIDGGTPQRVAEIAGGGLAGRPYLSTDGSLLAYLHDVSSPEPARRVEILRGVDGAPVKALNLPVNAVRLSWSRDSNSVRFLNPENGILNLWEQSLAGGEPKQLTHFTSDAG
jgi:hypothetical protein